MHNPRTDDVDDSPPGGVLVVPLSSFLPLTRLERVPALSATLY